MWQLPPDFGNRLLDILLTIPALQSKDNRDLLLRNLPPGPVNAISRSNASVTDLYNIVTAAEGWGQLTGGANPTGEWALAIVAQNALKFFASGLSQGRALDDLLTEISIVPIEAISDRVPLEPIEEVIIGQDERLPIDFLTRGLRAAQAVAMVTVSRIINGVQQKTMGHGTGWLMAPGLLITNYHVIQARDLRKEAPATAGDFKAQALNAAIWFNYDHRQAEYTVYNCVELVNADTQLDYALLRLSATPSAGPNRDLSYWGHLALLKGWPKPNRGDRLNIIQHPEGGPKQLAIRSNFYVDAVSTPDAPHRLRYLTDTEPGASGSPICNDDWQVVALHQAAIKLNTAITYKSDVITYQNQGIDIAAILANLPEAIRKEIGATQANHNP